VREDSSGTLEVARGENGKVRFRIELREERVAQFKDGPTLVTRLQVAIGDGDKIQVWMEQLGEQMVMPVNDSTFGFIQLDTLVERMQRDTVRCRVSETEIDGRPVWHIRFEPKDTENRRLVRHDYYVDKEHGVILRRLGFDGAGRERLRLDLQGFTFNEPIDPERFVFRATPTKTGRVIRAVPAPQNLPARPRQQQPPSQP